MYGIKDLISNTEMDFPFLVSKINDCIAHRGPNASDLKQIENEHLDHLRLSIIDLSEEANQPFYDNEHAQGIHQTISFRELL